jgi:hypothetical protein
METSLMAFVVCGMVAMLFCAAMLGSELGWTLPAKPATGDSTLRGQSVRWIGGISLAAAVLICCLTN